ncbi:hypothetical protein EUX98_g8736 [Antrodiella citrinella]|uniref:Myb/SANT-like domain-containing protein n=1 Tax=Antrodiella citrinella TaxID=2447956 RepID=A0A4S4M3G7_9APHY|nr:hypothetical protein EUX98_g8736 [Antrodiella citrinella]
MAGQPSQDAQLGAREQSPASAQDQPISSQSQPTQPAGEAAPSHAVPPKSAKTNWKTTEDTILMVHLLDTKIAGEMSENGFKAVVWKDAERKFTKQGIKKTAKQCHTRSQTIKKDYIIFKEMRKLSGAGWNAETSTIVLSDGVWADFLKAHPTCTRYRARSFPLYDKCQETGSRDSKDTDILVSGKLDAHEFTCTFSVPPLPRVSFSPPLCITLFSSCITLFSSCITLFSSCITLVT